MTFSLLTATATAAALVVPPLALAQLLPGVGLTLGGAAVARTYRGANERMQVALEQILDRLERGDVRSSSPGVLPVTQTFVKIAEEVRKAFETPPKPKTRS